MIRLDFEQKANMPVDIKSGLRITSVLILKVLRLKDSGQKSGVMETIALLNDFGIMVAILLWV